MPAIKIIIADDEPEARKLILYYLGQSGISCQTFEAVTGTQALALLKKENADILFLDVKMPELSGMDVLQLRDKKILPAIIFTTAHDEYALAAFDSDAIDYLLKPFDQNRFSKALKKAIDYIAYTELNIEKERFQTLSIKNGCRTMVIPFQDIEYFLSDGPYVRVVTMNKNYLIHKPLYQFERELPAHIFLRVHRSCILNISRISEVKSLLNGDYIILMMGGREIRASRTYRENLRSALGRI
jgi:two-component system, LytTR family, response regulator